MSGCAEKTWFRAIVMPGATHTDPRATPLIRDADHAGECKLSRSFVRVSRFLSGVQRISSLKVS
eukprot:3332326-Prymnesium_polylepis.1